MAVWDQPRSFWTWGNVSDEPSEAERKKAAADMSKRRGVEIIPPPIPSLTDISIRSPRLEVPAALQGFVSTEHHDRLLHKIGRAHV